MVALMTKRNNFSRCIKTIIITLMLACLLTFNVGRVTRVSAMATTIAAAASAALMSAGITYIVYTTLTGATVSIPSVDTSDNLVQWINNVGSDAISRSPYLTKVYNKFYQLALDNVLPSDWVLDFDQDLLRGLYNDLKSVDSNQSISSFTETIDTTFAITNGFTYSSTIYVVPELFRFNGTIYTIDNVPSLFGTPVPYNGVIAIKSTSYGDDLVFVYTNITDPVRNYLKSNGRYKGQTFVNGQWVDVNSYP